VLRGLGYYCDFMLEDWTVFVLNVDNLCCVVQNVDVVLFVCSVSVRDLLSNYFVRVQVCFHVLCQI